MSKYMDNKRMFLEPSVSQYGSRMVMTNVNKPTKTKYWNIDTQFCNDYNSLNSTEYNISLPEPINDVKSIKVKDVQIPITFYNISSSLGNNILQVVHNTTEHNIILPNNQYDSISLATEINNQFTSLGIELTIDLSNNQHKTNITNHSVNKQYDIRFAISNKNSCLGANVEFDKKFIKSKLGWILGFRNIAYTIKNTTTLTSESVYYTYLKNIFLVIDEFSKGNQNTFISPMYDSLLNKNILAKISLDYESFPFGSILNGNDGGGYLLSDSRSYSGKVNLQKLKIQLVNIYGFPIDMNGVDFSFSLEIEYE